MSYIVHSVESAVVPIKLLIAEYRTEFLRSKTFGIHKRLFIRETIQFKSAERILLTPGGIEHILQFFSNDYIEEHLTVSSGSGKNVSISKGRWFSDWQSDAQGLFQSIDKCVESTLHNAHCCLLTTLDSICPCSTICENWWEVATLAEPFLWLNENLHWAID